MRRQREAGMGRTAGRTRGKGESRKYREVWKDKKRERNYRDDGFSDAADEEAGPAHPSAISNPPH